MKNTNYRSDPRNLKGRLYEQMDAALKDLEDNGNMASQTERYRTLKLISDVMKVWIVLEGVVDESSTTGSAVRKYSGAFRTTNVAGKRKPNARSPAFDISAAFADSDSE